MTKSRSSAKKVQALSADARLSDNRSLPETVKGVCLYPQRFFPSERAIGAFDSARLALMKGRYGDALENAIEAHFCGSPRAGELVVLINSSFLDSSSKREVLTRKGRAWTQERCVAKQLDNVDVESLERELQREASSSSALPIAEQLSLFKAFYAYRDGAFSHEDHCRARTIILLLARENNAAALRALSKMYSDGLYGQRRSAVRAQETSLRAVRAGSAQALGDVAETLWEEGQKKLAKKLWAVVKKEDCCPSSVLVGYVRHYLLDGQSSSGNSGSSNKSAEERDGSAAFSPSSLVVLPNRKRNWKQVEKVFTYCEFSCRYGHPEGLFDLARLFESGIGPKRKEFEERWGIRETDGKRIAAVLYVHLLKISADNRMKALRKRVLQRTEHCRKSNEFKGVFDEVTSILAFWTLMSRFYTCSAVGANALSAAENSLTAVRDALLPVTFLERSNASLFCRGAAVASADSSDIVFEPSLTCLSFAHNRCSQTLHQVLFEAWKTGSLSVRKEYSFKSLREPFRYISASQRDILSTTSRSSLMKNGSSRDGGDVDADKGREPNTSTRAPEPREGEQKAFKPEGSDRVVAGDTEALKKESSQASKKRGSLHRITPLFGSKKKLHDQEASGLRNETIGPTKAVPPEAADEEGHTTTKQRSSRARAVSDSDDEQQKETKMGRNDSVGTAGRSYLSNQEPGALPSLYNAYSPAGNPSLCSEALRDAVALAVSQKGRDIAAVQQKWRQLLGTTTEAVEKENGHLVESEECICHRMLKEHSAALPRLCLDHFLSSVDPQFYFSAAETKQTLLALQSAVTEQLLISEELEAQENFLLACTSPAEAFMILQESEKRGLLRKSRILSQGLKELRSSLEGFFQDFPFVAKGDESKEDLSRLVASEIEKKNRPPRLWRRSREIGEETAGEQRVHNRSDLERERERESAVSMLCSSAGYDDTSLLTIGEQAELYFTQQNDDEDRQKTRLAVTLGLRAVTFLGGFDIIDNVDNAEMEWLLEGSPAKDALRVVRNVLFHVSDRLSSLLRLSRVGERRDSGWLGSPTPLEEGVEEEEGGRKEAEEKGEEEGEPKKQEEAEEDPEQRSQGKEGKRAGCEEGALQMTAEHAEPSASPINGAGAPDRKRDRTRPPPLPLLAEVQSALNWAESVLPDDELLLFEGAKRVSSLEEALDIHGQLAAIQSVLEEKKEVVDQLLSFRTGRELETTLRQFLSSSEAEGVRMEEPFMLAVRHRLQEIEAEAERLKKLKEEMERQRKCDEEDPVADNQLDSDDTQKSGKSSALKNRIASKTSPFRTKMAMLYATKRDSSGWQFSPVSPPLVNAEEAEDDTKQSLF